MGDLLKLRMSYHLNSIDLDWVLCPGCVAISLAKSDCNGEVLQALKCLKSRVEKSRVFRRNPRCDIPYSSGICCMTPSIWNQYVVENMWIDKVLKNRNSIRESIWCWKTALPLSLLAHNTQKTLVLIFWSALSSILGCLALRVVKVCRYGNHSVLDRLSQVRFSGFLHFGKNHGAYLLRIESLGLSILHVNLDVGLTLFLYYVVGY